MNLNPFANLTHRRSLAACGTVVLSSTALAAQELYGTIDGSLADLFAKAVDCNDVDGDGLGDLVVLAAVGGIPGPQSLGGTPDVYWYSGSTLNPVGLPVFGELNSGSSKAFSHAGDFDGDGIDDIAVHYQGNPNVPGSGAQVQVHGGGTRQTLARFPDPGIYTWGWVIAPLGDVDQDGYDDIIVGGIFEPSFVVYGGPAGHVIRQHGGVGGTDNSAASIGDVDGDGVPDYVIGSGSAGRVTLFSGATGAIIRVDTRGPTEGFGHSVTAVGDIDGDGVPDYAAGAPGLIFISIVESRVYVVSGATGNDIYTFESLENDFDQFGVVVDGRFDANGDGVQDLVAFAPRPGGPGRSGYVHVYSLRTGSLLWRRRPPPFPSLDTRIASAAMVGDLDGDGLSEWVANDPNAEHGGNQAGRIWIFRGQPGDSVEYCSGVPNSTGQSARLVWSGPLSVGLGNQWFELTGGPPHSFAMVIYGVAQNGVPFGDGHLCVGGPTLYRLAAPFPLDASGRGELDVSWMSGPNVSGPGAWQPGTAWAMQAVYRDVGGPGGANFNTTSAWRVVFTQ